MEAALGPLARPLALCRAEFRLARAAVRHRIRVMVFVMCTALPREAPAAAGARRSGETVALRLLAASPLLARARVAAGATRQAAKDSFLDEIGHHVYAGDTALHVAAAAYRPAIAERLIAAGADVRAKNRRAAEPLHYAVDVQPDSSWWNPRAQAATVACLIAATRVGRSRA
jgi:hypothetical protein